MRRVAATVLLSTFLLFPFAARAAEATPETVESELAVLLKEMDAMSSELDRIEEITAAPKATGLRIEIHRSGNPAGPVTARLLVKGIVEEEKEWTRTERDLFAGGAPLVFQTPVLPGAYVGRIEIAHPSWKTTPAVEIKANPRKGETVLIKLVLSVPPGKTDPALSLAGGK